eukprot:5018655-Alexandrium_andersonii.AAC.1
MGWQLLLGDAPPRGSGCYGGVGFACRRDHFALCDADFQSLEDGEAIFATLWSQGRALSLGSVY